MNRLFACFLCLLSASAMAAPADASALAQARTAFKSQISYPGTEPAAPLPPPKVFRKVSFPSAVGALGAYLTPDPKDSKRHPAIIWITGGDCNSIGEVWEPGPRDNEQTASAYRKAGIVIMFPSLRGGNDNPGKHEIFYGEVDDVLAAFDYLAKQAYVDPTRIYLGGHSTGGTLALLTAEVRNPFRAVFAFGPVSDVSKYGKKRIPVDFARYDARELSLRAPGNWLASAKGQVFVIEGDKPPANSFALADMKKRSTNPALRFVSIAGASHFSVLAPANEVIAAKILSDAPSRPRFDLSEAELQAAFR